MTTRQIIPRRAFGSRGVAIITDPDGNAEKLEQIYANLWPGETLTALIGHHGLELVSGVGKLRLKPEKPETGPDGKLLPWPGPSLQLSMSTVCSDGWAGFQELASLLRVNIQWTYHDDNDESIERVKRFTYLPDE